MRVFLDTNILVDVLGERKPFNNLAEKIVTLADQRKITLVVSALTYANVNYIISRDYGREQTLEKLRKFKAISEICPLDETIIEKGLLSKFTDFEDALQYYSALRANCEMIITRNGKDFKESAIPVLTPDEFLKGFLN
ncbi:PIN domain-containing protein [uncultured Arcticibacterium sp.]|uniref:type II toxin-antitoxin system VapC family toxin n=1 Tax=uncultured Arcticibacterium sp. TaxID=2173042 RepID=UPI0030F9B6F5